MEAAGSLPIRKGLPLVLTLSQNSPLVSPVVIIVPLVRVSLSADGLSAS
jgi:hypothetical protein